MYPQEKDKMKQTMSKSKSKKGRKRRKNQNKSTSTTQERRHHARGIRILQARKERGGGVAPRRNNRITESATKESREAKVKAKKAIQESNGKRQDERTNERKRYKEWGTAKKKKKKKNEEKKEKKKTGKNKRKTARVSGRYYVDYLGLNRGDAS